MHKLGLLFTLLFSVFSLQAQDLEFVRNHIKKLASPEFQGRGYINNGDQIASDYLKAEFEKFGLSPFQNSFFQEYSFEVNTFPDKMEVSINGKKLKPAQDFYVNPGSLGEKGKFKIIRFGLNEMKMDTPKLVSFLKADHSKHYIFLDTAGWGKDDFRKAMREAISSNLLKARGIVEVADTGLYFAVRTFANDYTKLNIRKKSIPVKASTIKIIIDQKLISHSARNIIGFLPGETDTFIVLTAHYDHLGHMGKNTYFPGANDNASGTSMVLDLLRELSKKEKHRYSYAFMLFSGEEAGLLGSQYYVNHPLFPLSKIKQVLNFDMVGTGSGGINIYNGSVLRKEFDLLDTINKVNNFGVKFNIKSTSRGSDHYSFHQKGIPALFILTEGKEVGYHVPADKPEFLPMAAYEKLYKIIYQYIEAKENGEIIYRPNTYR